MVINLSILNETTFLNLEKRAALHSPVDSRKVFDVYSYFSKNPRKLNSIDDLISAISIAYSWMLTMLDILGHDENNLKKLVVDIQLLQNIQSAEQLQQKEIDIREILKALTMASNNSVIGASKVLHLFYPVHVPIFDSRVIRAWNIIFPAEMRIPTLSSNNQVGSYIKYWFALLYWRDKLAKTTIRELEKPLFDYGGFLKTKKKKEVAGVESNEF